MEQSSDEDTTSNNNNEELLSLSLAIVQGYQAKKTIILQGLMDKLGLKTEATQPLQVTVVDGGQMQCSQMAPQISWWTQGQTF